MAVVGLDVDGLVRMGRIVSGGTLFSTWSQYESP